MSQKTPWPTSYPIYTPPRSVYVPLFYIVLHGSRGISSLAIRPVEGRSKPRITSNHFPRIWDSEAESIPTTRSNVLDYVPRSPHRSLWGLSSTKSTIPTLATDEKNEKSPQQPSCGLSGVEPTSSAATKVISDDSNSSRPLWGLSGVNSMKPTNAAKEVENRLSQSSLDQQAERSFTEVSSIPKSSNVQKTSLSEKNKKISHRPLPSPSGAESSRPTGFKIRRIAKDTSVQPLDLQGNFSDKISSTPRSTRENFPSRPLRLSWGVSRGNSNKLPIDNFKNDEKSYSPSWDSSMPKSTVDIPTVSLTTKENTSIDSSRPSWGLTRERSTTSAEIKSEISLSTSPRVIWGLPAEKAFVDTPGVPVSKRENTQISFTQPSWGLPSGNSPVLAKNRDEKFKSIKNSSSQISWGLRLEETPTRISSAQGDGEKPQSNSSKQLWGLSGSLSTIPSAPENESGKNTPHPARGLSNIKLSDDHMRNPFSSRLEQIETQSQEIELSQNYNKDLTKNHLFSRQKYHEELPPNSTAIQYESSLKISQENLSLPLSRADTAKRYLEGKFSSPTSDQRVLSSETEAGRNEDIQANKLQQINSNSEHILDVNSKPEFPWRQLRARTNIPPTQSETLRKTDLEAKMARREEEAKSQSYIPLSGSGAHRLRGIKATETIRAASDFKLDRKKISPTSEPSNDVRSTETKQETIGSNQIGNTPDPETYSETKNTFEPRLIQSSIDQLNTNQNSVPEKDSPMDFISSSSTADSTETENIEKEQIENPVSKSLPEKESPVDFIFSLPATEPIETETIEKEQVEEPVSKPKKQKKKRGVENKSNYDDGKSNKVTGRDKDKARREAQYLRKEEEKLEAQILLEKKLERQRIKAEKKAARKAAPTPILLPQYIKIANLAVALKIRYEELSTKMKELGYEETQPDLILNSEDSALIAAEYNFEPIPDKGEGEDIKARDPHPNPVELPLRPPVVTIMGHVDHGKTTLLDYLRKSSVAAGEHGGITQHIGAFSVAMPGGKTITFLDTPGHAAFLSMRQRGANVTDIVVLVVAADDSVKPQTLEAINHAKSANVPMIVAINKIDKPEIDVEQVKLDLARYEVEIEDFGGDTQVVCVSGKTGQGMDELEETIMALADILDLHAESAGAAEGWVLEASKKAVGKVATILIRRGTLHPGDIIVAGTTWAKVRVLRNEAGDEIDKAGPGTPVEVDGWREQPLAGDEVLQTIDEIKAKRVVDYRIERYERSKLAIDMESINSARNESRQLKSMVKAAREVAIEEKKSGKSWNFVAPIQEPKPEGPKSVYFVVRADVSGSVEAVLDQIKNLGTKDVEPVILRSNVGQVSEFDIEHAAAANGKVINFNSRIDPHIRRVAEESNVKIIDNNIIYALVDDVRAELSTHLPPIISQRVLGEALVSEIFMITVRRRKEEPVAGCKMKQGSILRNSKVRVFREGEKVFDGVLASLKVGKNNVTEVKNENEFGLSFEGWHDFKVDDLIQHYEEIHEKRYL
ncbi:Translation initiation factor [Podosphaera aphanis]|nr:Translation initiation factor [Podosphaera aphanis]